MRRVLCFGGKLNGQYLELEDSMHTIQIPAAEPESELWNPDPLSFRVPEIKIVTYLMRKYAMKMPHPCVPDAELRAWWYFLSIRSPHSHAEEFMWGVRIVADPPHSGWIRWSNIIHFGPLWWSDDRPVPTFFMER